MLELACDDVIFHFNKKHLQDPTIPMWVLKAKGKSYYVEHVDCQCPWSTKETPDNDHTKGSIKIKNCLLTISDDNVATIAVLKESDKARLRNAEKGIVRIITTVGSTRRMQELFETMEIKHGPFKSVEGACGTDYYITDIYKREDFTALALAMPAHSFRELLPNEPYYSAYDDKGKSISADDWDPFDDESDE